MLNFVKETNHKREQHAVLSPPPTLAMALLPEGGVEQVIDVLEAQAARAIFTERSDKEELHNELFPALQTIISIIITNTSITTTRQLTLAFGNSVFD